MLTCSRYLHNRVFSFQIRYKGVSEEKRNGNLEESESATAAT